MPRRLAAIASTCAVAIVMMLALPIAQLSIAQAVPACCCPNPAKCHCPDHHPGRTLDKLVKACHGDPQTAAPQPLPSFTAPPAVALAPPPAAIAIVSIPLPAPHVPPAPDRRAAPS